MKENFKWLNKCIGFNDSGGDYVSNCERMLKLLRVNFIPWKNYSLRIILPWRGIKKYFRNIVPWIWLSYIYVHIKYQHEYLYATNLSRMCNWFIPSIEVEQSVKRPLWRSSIPLFNILRYVWCHVIMNARRGHGWWWTEVSRCYQIFEFWCLSTLRGIRCWGMSTTSSAVSTSAPVTVQRGVHAGNLSRGPVYDAYSKLIEKNLWSSRDIWINTRR